MCFDTVPARKAAYRIQDVPCCPICGSLGEVLHEGVTDRAYGVPGQSQIVRCTQCGSGWLNPVPIADDLERCYVTDYYTHEPPDVPSMGSSRTAALLRGAVLGARKGYVHLRPGGVGPILGRLLEHVPPIWSRASFNLRELMVPYSKAGRLLEVGCGNGGYLAIMRMLGWDVYGLDPDPKAAEVARAAARCAVHVGTIENAPFAKGSFDAIVSSHVIEHVYDPKSLVAAAAQLLAKNGVIAVQTPNFESLGHKLFATDWHCLDAPRHLCLFTPNSLRRLFVESGAFHSVRTVTVSRGSLLTIRRRYAVRATGRFLSEVPLDWRKRLAELLFRATEAVGNRVFDWGEEIQCTAVRA